MPRQTNASVRDRYAGLLEFLNTYLDERNYYTVLHRVLATWVGGMKRSDRPLAIQIARDITLKEAIRVQGTLSTIFESPQPRGRNIIDPMQAVWIAAFELGRRREGIKKCPRCPTFFLPRKGQTHCSADCSMKAYNARRARKSTAIAASAHP